MSLIDDFYLNKLKEKFALTDKAFQKLFHGIIKAHTLGVTPAEVPTLIIIGAQPGAGKTELQKHAELKLSKNAVLCNADNFRDVHPFSKDIKQFHPDDYASLTAEYAQRWNDELCKYCLDHKLNYILETTFRSGDQLNATISHAKQNGYQVDIFLLAVHERLSRLGIQYRYEEALAATGFGRKVSLYDHDIRYMSIPFALRRVQNAGLYDNLDIFCRSVVVSGIDNVEGVNLVAHNPADPLKVYQEELVRAWPDKLKIHFEQRRSEVLTMMTSRKASVKEIEQFKRSVGLTTSLGLKRKGPRL
ncbi:zeta toxin family protein [Mucilaginibacter defluvii]|uniref:Zeta toxin domain-containing protein n=1 Tax=Mucilaginibacter defluvii TaxID=1196019 RepID=A0ABP9G799_9SPHI